eukprot:CAMPEP_0117486082 /NCGR_PEP_ID=MMETSP0784-20121206/15295_1 /TAXON_ID=39447 /ORGANISM="" /LENGTH=71 /DNA_ID=CAMNT_0005280685 /DNA_START=190 /DNA_END=405 /DNA_ORIENTATION=-
MGQVQAHDTVVDVTKGCEDLEIGRGTAQGLHVHAPLLGVESARLESALHAELLGLVYKLVAAVVARARVAL